ncbi:uncharacterized protein DFL_002120 [Arthrobotrys flagrans]|uniref:Uncharacterized protein n=1 Tax=Arthrobotrys flagrans TaxID=97331 RepID=A0A437AAM5_ARTFL|nr:hypothetical protein DFL_002120 [Arthrobotrys flagrans]
MPRQSAFIYMDKDAVISVLSTLEQANPVQVKIYLHTQLSPVQRAPRYCDETSISEFLECLMDPMSDPNIGVKLRVYWWSLECTLPNGVIIIHSLSRSLYNNVYIFEFSPVTGVFCKLVPREISEMISYLSSKDYNPEFFPRVPSDYRLSDKEKLRVQLGSGMSSLANTVGRRLSGFSLNTISGGFIDGVKNNIIPTLMTWNTFQYKHGNPSSGFTVHPNIMSSNTLPRGAENRPSSFPPERPGFLRSASATYLRHPLQTLRHHGSSVSVLSTRVSEDSPMVTTPSIILTTPEQATAILKLSASVPKNPKGKGFWQSVGETISPKKFETPTFVFWKDVFDQICFQTKLSPGISSHAVELDTNIHRQVADNLNRLLIGVTDMYVKEADGMQLDFVRMKIPPDEEDHQPFNVRMYKGSGKPSGRGASKRAGRSFQFFPAEVEGFNSESSHGSIALSEGIEPTAEGNRRQGKMLANNDLKPDQKLELDFDPEELEFSSVPLSQDTYLVEAVLAAWFADASEWMKESGLRWRHTLFDRQAKGPRIETETVTSPV